MAALGERYAHLLSVHRLTPVRAPGAFHDATGEALRRLGVRDVGQYLVRPDADGGGRSGGTELGELAGYPARWLPAPRAH